MGVWEDLNEHNLDNGGEQRGTGSFVFDRRLLLHSSAEILRSEIKTPKSGVLPL